MTRSNHEHGNDRHEEWRPGDQCQPGDKVFGETVDLPKKLIKNDRKQSKTVKLFSSVVCHMKNESIAIGRFNIVLEMSRSRVTHEAVVQLKGRMRATCWPDMGLHESPIFYLLPFCDYICLAAGTAGGGCRFDCRLSSWQRLVFLETCARPPITTTHNNITVCKWFVHDRVLLHSIEGCRQNQILSASAHAKLFGNWGYHRLWQLSYCRFFWML